MNNFDIFLKTCNSQIKQIFKNQTSPTSKWLKEITKEISLSSTAKRIRPKLIYYFYQNIAPHMPTNDVLTIAISTELFHNASLLHDDIIDNAAKRRSKTTAHHTTSIPTAILSGDWLYSYALKQLLKLQNIQIYESALEMVMVMSEAASLEQEKIASITLTETEWKKIAYGKTGALISWAIYSLAILSDKKNLIKPLTTISKKLGIIFQMLDDLYDFYPHNEKKTPFQDLKNKNPNYLIVQTLKNESFQKEITNLYSTNNQEFQRIGTMIWESNIPRSVNQQTRIYLQEIKEILYQHDMKPLYEDIKKWLKKSSKHIQNTNEQNFWI